MATWNPGLSSLQDVLVTLYPSDADMQRVLDQAQLPRQFFNFDGSVMNVWHGILLEAERRNGVQAIIDVARAEYAGHEGLQLAEKEYQASKARRTEVDVAQRERGNKPPGTKVRLSGAFWGTLTGIGVLISAVLIWRAGLFSGPAPKATLGPSTAQTPPAVTLAIQTPANPSPPVATPTQPSNVPADVLISQFNRRGDVPDVDIAHLLERDLLSKLRQYNLSKVRVKVITQPINDEDEAQTLVNQQNSKIIIYGWYDQLGVAVNIFLVEGQQPGRTVPGTSDLPLMAAGDDHAQLKFTLQKALPENVSFLSLFVIGQLDYLANNYQAGHAAFNAAMTNIPTSVAIENKALIPFFTARQLDMADSKDVTAIICGYTQAIQFDPTFDAAYNNLAVRLVRDYTLPNIEGYPSALTDDAFACLAQIGYGRENIGTLTPSQLFAKTIELQPTASLPAYNKLSFEWGYPGYYETPTTTVKSQLAVIVARDPTIWGAYAISGNITFEERNFTTAAHLYTQALKLDANNVKLQVNLGQAYLQQGAEAQAEAEFKRSLKTPLTLEHVDMAELLRRYLARSSNAMAQPKTEPLDPEAALALANLAYHRSDWQTALTYLAKIPLAQKGKSYFTSPGAMAALLQSKILFEQHYVTETITLLEQVAPLATDENLVRYLLALLYTRQENLTAAQEQWKALHSSILLRPLLPSRNYLFHQNASAALAWDTLVKTCGMPTEGDFTQWVSSHNPCLPTELDKQIRSVYDQLQQWLPYRLYYQKGTVDPGLNLGKACPYVFTRAANSANWQFDTTILYKRIGAQAETEQRRPLARFDGQLLIQEVEPETSYLDNLYVLVEDEHGQLLHLQPQAQAKHTQSALQSSDDAYVILNQGDSLLLTFADYQKIPNAKRFWIVAEGYYVPWDQ